jgi:hypothetical protein
MSFDYCHAVLTGRPAITLCLLHRFMNPAVRTILGLSPCDHAYTAKYTDWLPLKQLNSEFWHVSRTELPDSVTEDRHQLHQQVTAALSR